MEARDNQLLAALSARCYQEPQLLQLARQQHHSEGRRHSPADMAANNTSKDVERLGNETADRRRFKSSKNVADQGLMPPAQQYYPRYVTRLVSGKLSVLWTIRDRIVEHRFDALRTLIGSRKKRLFKAAIYE
jgi:hypothetical protein